MSKRIAEIQESIAKSLNALPGVFSTVQWGGRAYKLPGPGGSKRKPKLVAHVWVNKAGDAVGVDFKLERNRAREVVDQFDWIEPHSFRTLAPSGWISAEVRTKSQCKVMAKLLAECRGQFPIERQGSSPTRRGKPDRDPVARRIDVVLRQKRAEGWTPAHRDDF